MITAICSYPLRPGSTYDDILSELPGTVRFYKGRPALIRKYVTIDMENRRGAGIYLWEARAPAEAYFAEVTPMIEAQVGAKPVVTYFDTPLVVDNETGRVVIGGEDVTASHAAGPAAGGEVQGFVKKRW